MKILIIEDERQLSDNIAIYMMQQGYLCERASTYQTALNKVCVYDYDCILLDLTLPGGSGLDILQEIRRRNNPAGVIIISAKDSLDDRLKGLAIGADDYLPKPFHLSELAMRVYAIIRRRSIPANGSNTIVFGNLSIDIFQQSIRVEDQTALTLTHTEMELLLFLISNKERTVTRQAIAEHLFGEMSDVMDDFNFLYSHIKNLKNKLKTVQCDFEIQSVYGIGYRLKRI